MQDKLVVLTLVLALVLGITACSSDSEKTESVVSVQERDRQEIESTLEETAGRWRYGDKAILYEQEFEYLRAIMSYDEYLENDRIKRLESDTVRAFDVKDVVFFGRDSASVSVDVVFVGPTGDTTHFPQQWVMYYHQDRWIRPSLSSFQNQKLFEEQRRQADSAAAAEEGLEDW